MASGKEGIGSYRKIRGNEYDFGQVIGYQTSQIAKLGKDKHKSDEDLSAWIASVNDLEDMLAGIWTDPDFGKQYIADMNEIKKVEGKEKKNNEEKIRFTHLKLQALMRLENDAGFQGMKAINVRA